jgi:hypothetical protein
LKCRHIKNNYKNTQNYKVMTGSHKVRGSIPLISTILIPYKMKMP